VRTNWLSLIKFYLLKDMRTILVFITILVATYSYVLWRANREKNALGGNSAVIVNFVPDRSHGSSNVGPVALARNLEDGQIFYIQDDLGRFEGCKVGSQFNYRRRRSAIYFVNGSCRFKSGES
jgi:hypothetical protein